MLGDFANQCVNGFNLLRKKLVVGDAAARVLRAFGAWLTGGCAVLVVHINQVNVAGHIELARTQFAHAHHPHLGSLTAGQHGCAVLCVQFSG